MPQIRTLAAFTAVAATTLFASVPAASAATTTIHQTDAAGAPYGGNVQALLLGSASVSTSFGRGRVRPRRCSARSTPTGPD